MDRGGDDQSVYTHEKVDVLDLVINVLKEHERGLHKLAEDLRKMLEELRSPKMLSALERLGENRAQLHIICNDWLDFKEKGKNSDLVVFDVDEKSLKFNSISGNSIYQYSEPMLHVKLRLEGEGEAYKIRREEVKALLEKLARGKFRCGIKPSISIKLVSLGENVDALVFRFHPEINKLKSWLSKELDIPAENVIYGKMVSKSLDY